MPNPWERDWSAPAPPTPPMAPWEHDWEQEGIRPEPRGLTGVGKDLLVSVGGGANALLETVGNIYALGTGDWDNWASNKGAQGRQFFQDRKSPQLIQLETDRKAKVDAAESTLGKAGTAFWETIKSPSLLSSFIAEQTPLMLPIAAVGRGAGALAKVAGAGSKVVAGTATGAAVGTGAAMQGADSGKQAYEQLMSLPEEVWQQNDRYQSMVSDGLDPELAKQSIANGLAQNSAIASGIASVGLNLIPGARMLEKSLAGVKLPSSSVFGNVLKGFLGETAQEGLEEGAGALFANMAASKVDPLADIMEGVGEATGLGAAAGPFGAIAGATASRGRRRDVENTVNRIADPGKSVEDAIAETDQMMSDMEDNGLRNVGPGDGPTEVVSALKPGTNEPADTAQANNAGQSIQSLERQADVYGRAVERATNEGNQEVAGLARMKRAEVLAELELAYQAKERQDQAQKDADYRPALDQRADQEVPAAITATPQAELQAKYAPGQGPINPAMAEAFRKAGIGRQTAEQPPAAISPTPTPETSILVKSDGTPFATEKSASISKKFRDNPGASVVPVEGGFGVQVVETSEEFVSRETAESPVSAATQAMNQAPENQKWTPSTEETVTLSAETAEGSAAPAAGTMQTSEVLQSPESAIAAVSDPAQTLPEILAKTPAAYKKKMVKAASIKPGSPGYEAALTRIDTQYEQEYNKALAGIPFAEYQKLNQDTPESINRQAHAQLQQEYGVGPLPASAKTDVQIANSGDTLAAMANNDKGGRSSTTPQTLERPKADITKLREQGFDTGSTWLHGSDTKINKFDAARLGSNYKDQASKEGIFLTSSQEGASFYGPVTSRFFVRPGRQKIITGDDISEASELWLAELEESDPGQAEYQRATKEYQNSPEINKGLELSILEAKRSGYDSAIYEDEFGEKTLIIFDPENIETAENPDSTPRSQSAEQPPAQKSELAQATEAMKEVAAALREQNRKSEPASSLADTSDVGGEMLYNRRMKGVDISDLKNAANPTEMLALATKQKMWERPDYQAMVDSGVKPETAHIVKQIYDAIPAKPRYKEDKYVFAYAEGIDAVRKSVNKFIESPAMQKALYESLLPRGMQGPALISSFVRNPESDTLLDEVFPKNANGKRWGKDNTAGNDRAVALDNKLVKTLQVGMNEMKRAIDAVQKEGFPGKQELWQRSYLIVEEGGKFNLRSKKRKYSNIESFDDRNQAVEAARKLVETEKKDVFREPETDVQMSSRSGADIRNGRNVSTEELRSTIGLKAVNFGNWMQSGGRSAVERQAHVNSAYDAFHDLAGIIGVPVEAMSLNGMLGLAVGAQGKGRAAAHFVPGVNEINLTRRTGAGSLAHEWAHGLDHYFGVQAGFARSDTPFLTQHRMASKGSEIRTEIVEAFSAIHNAMTKMESVRTPEEMETLRSQLAESSRERLQRTIDQSINQVKRKNPTADTAKLDQIANKLLSGDIGEYERLGKSKNAFVHAAVNEFREEYKKQYGYQMSLDTAQALNYSAAALKNTSDMEQFSKTHSPQITQKTQYLKDAQQKEGPGPAYWSTPWEMFARAFEIYVADKLAENEGRNDYLTAAWKTNPSGVSADEAMVRYPQGADREQIRAAFDFLVGGIKYRKTDQGTALFSRDEDTKTAYESRIDELFAGESRSRKGVRVLDRADILDLLGYGDKPLHLKESEVKKRDAAQGWEVKHPGMTAEQWKKVPDWIENPVAVFESQTVPGSLVLYGPELINDKPVRIILRPNAEMGGMDVHVLVNAYEESGAGVTPVDSWTKAGKALLYLDQKESPAFSKRSGLRLPRDVRQLRGYKRKVLTDSDLVKYREAEEGSGGASMSALSARSGAKGSTVESVSKAIAPMLEKLNQFEGIDVEVVQSVTDMPKEALENVDPTGRYKGAFFQDKVYLFADNISGRRDAQVVLAHELIGHKGVLAGASMEEWSNIKGQVEALVAQKNVTAVEIMAEVDRRYPNASDETRIKEFIAIAAEHRQLRGRLKELVEQVKAILRRWLKELGFTGPFSESDILLMLQNSERNLKMRRAESWAESESGMEGQPAPVFAQAPPADDNNGSFDPSNPNILFSQDIPDRTLNSIADRVLVKPKNRSILGAVQSFIDERRDDFNLWARQGLVDEFDSIAKLETQEYGDLRDAKDSAYKAAAFTKNSETVLDAAMNFGAPVLRDGGLELDGKVPGLVKIFEPLAKFDLVREWELWAAATRANRLLADRRENLFTQDDVDIILNSVTGKKLELFQKVHRNWQVFNKRILDLGQAAGLINAEERKLWENDDYVPFHRVSELTGEKPASGRKRGMSGQKSGIKRLSGGVEKISIMESIVRNTASMIDASMKNIAMQRTIELAEQAGVVEEVKDAAISTEEARKRLDEAGIDYTPATLRAWKGLLAKHDARNGTVAVSVDGKAKRYLVHDPVLLRSMTGLGPTGVEGIMKVLRLPKVLLTELVTADPAFSLRNLIRDTLSTWVTVHGVKRNPIADAVRNVREAYRENDTFKAMKAQGVGGGGFYDVTPEGVRAHLERISGDASVMTSIAEFWHGYKRILGTTESANRMAVYDAAIKAGASKAEAAYQAMDVLNFSRHGEWKAVRILTQLVPFLNARVQGLDRLYRGAREGSTGWHQWNKGFMLKGAIVTAATLALLAANWDNDEYWDLPEWDRDTYYHFFVGGEHFRMPKPFEVGALFSTIPERLFEQFRGDADMQLLGQRMLNMVTETFAFDPIPQFIKPVAEVAMNRNSFTGQDILSQGMQYASPEAQYSPYTSKTFIEMADAMPDSAPEWMRSPARLEHLFKGYMGTLGGYVLMGSDYAARKIADSPARPELRIQDVPVLQSFIRDGEGSNKQVGRVYDMARDVDETWAAIRKYRGEGNIDKAKGLLADNKEKLKVRTSLNKVTNQMSQISSHIKRIYDDPELSPANKRQQIDELTRRRNELAKAMEEKFRSYF